MSGNKIDDQGAKYIADMVTDNKTLQVISLANNHIGDKGAQRIANSLVVNTSIRFIWLIDNKIGNKGAEKLVDALESNHSIKCLWIGGNSNISDHNKERIEAILKDPKRQGANQQSPLDQIGHFIAKKDEEITNLKDDLASKDKEVAKKEAIIEQCKEEIAMLEKHMVSKDEEILKKEAVKNGEVTEKNRAIAKVLGVITKRNKEIASLKESLKNSKSIETVDLTSGDGTEYTSNKRQRTDAKSYLAIQHEQNQKIVQIKEEKIAAETALEDAREDLEDSQEDMGRQVLFTDFLQSKIDELAALAEAGGVDRARVAEIKGRSYSLV